MIELHVSVVSRLVGDASDEPDSTETMQTIIRNYLNNRNFASGWFLIITYENVSHASRFSNEVNALLTLVLLELERID